MFIFSTVYSTRVDGQVDRAKASAAKYPHLLKVLIVARSEQGGEGGREGGGEGMVVSVVSMVMIIGSVWEGWGGELPRRRPQLTHHQLESALRASSSIGKISCLHDCVCPFGGVKILTSVKLLP